MERFAGYPCRMREYSESASLSYLVIEPFKHRRRHCIDIVGNFYILGECGHLSGELLLSHDIGAVVSYCTDFFILADFFDRHILDKRVDAVFAAEIYCMRVYSEAVYRGKMHLFTGHEIELCRDIFKCLYSSERRIIAVVVGYGKKIIAAGAIGCGNILGVMRSVGKIRVHMQVAHNHDDHMDVFTKLLKREKDVLCVERVMFNFPSRTLLDYSSGCTDRLRERLKKYAPNAKYLKLHTGQTVHFPDSYLEVLTTHEDILPLSIRARDGGAYRGMNETTTVFQIIFDDASVIFLGDAEESNGEALIALYGKNLLSCKYLQGAHHLINDDRSIYANIRAEKLLAPQGRFTVMTRFCDNIRYLTSLFGAENIYFAGDCTYVFTIKDGNESISYFESKGYVYDDSGY